MTVLPLTMIRYPGGIHGFQYVRFPLPIKDAANARTEEFVVRRLAAPST